MQSLEGRSSEEEKWVETKESSRRESHTTGKRMVTNIRYWCHNSNKGTFSPCLKQQHFLTTQRRWVTSPRFTTYKDDAKFRIVCNTLQNMWAPNTSQTEAVHPWVVEYKRRENETQGAREENNSVREARSMYRPPYSPWKLFIGRSR